MSGRGHRRLRLCSKKNYEGKKYAKKKALVVKIPLQRIELPLCKVSIPLTVVKDAPVDTIEALHSWLRNLQAIPDSQLCVKCCNIDYILHRMD